MKHQVSHPHSQETSGTDHEDTPIGGSLNGYGSIPTNTIFNGMNIHLPAILMFTRGTRFWPTAKLGHIFFLNVFVSYKKWPITSNLLQSYMAMGQNPMPLVNIKIAGKWMFIPLKMVLIGIDS